MNKIVISCAAFAAAALASAALLAGSATAAPAPQRYTEALAFDDLDLNTEAGRASMEKRIKAAARRVCAHGRDRFSAHDQASARLCEAEAIAKSREQVRQLVERRVALR